MKRALLLLAALGLAACGDEEPTGLGGPLLPGGGVTTFEVFLEPGDYLAFDTSFTGYVEPFLAGVQVVAEDYEGALDAHALTSFSIVRTVSVRDAGGTVVIDSVPNYFAGRLVLRLDTTRSDLSGRVRLAAYRLAESWDEGTATWSMRTDSVGRQEAWAQPGGTLSELIDTLSWTQAEGDSVTFEIDSTTVQLLRDTATAAKGIVIVAESPGSRVRINAMTLYADARSTVDPDTVVTTQGVAQQRTFIYSPEQSRSASDLRVGGVAPYRPVLRLRDDVADLQIACPGITRCFVPLSEVTINLASLQLFLDESPPGFMPDDSVQLAAIEVIETAGIPLERSPLGGALGVLSRYINEAALEDPAAQAVYELPISTLLREIVSDSTGDAPMALTILPRVEGPTYFGYFTFKQLPRLRLVVTVAQEVQLQ